MSSIQETNLKAIADAIRAKNGTTDPIQASTFPDLIAAISTGMRPRLIVQTVAGATVTAAKGEYSYSGTANDNGLCHFELPASDSQGEWAVTSSLNDTTVSSTINIGTQTLIMDTITDPVFSNNDWPTIIAACQSGNVPSTWAVGDSKMMTIDGVDYQIDIIGKDHDDYTDGSGKAPLTFQLHDCFTSLAMATSTDNGFTWESSDMCVTHLPGILSKMPTEVQNAIRKVNKKVRAEAGSNTVNTNAEKLFLLSITEIFDPRTVDVDEGTKYEYYSESASHRVKTISGSVTTWWLRSQSNASGYMYFPACVDTTGSIGSAYATKSCGVVPAFCF